MKRQLLTGLLAITTVFATAQTTYQRQSFTSSSKVIVDPKKNTQDFRTQLINLEAPSPNGDSYRSFLMRQKIESRQQHPLKPGKKTTQKTAANQPIVGRGTRMFRYPLPTSPKLDYAGGIPNDNTLAITNDGIAIVGINSVLWGYDTNTDTTIFDKGIVSLQTIGGFSPGLNRDFDPKLIYDPEVDRFILVYLQNSTPDDSKIKVCFSTTNNPLDPWNSYILPGNPLNNNRWSDFPAISITENELFLTLNLIVPDTTWQVGFDGSIIWQIDKNKGFAGDSVLTNTLWSDIKHDGKYTRNLFPVCGADGTADEALFLSNRNFDITNDTIFIMHLTGNQYDPNTTLEVKAATTTTNYGVPPNGRQQDTDISDPTKGLQTNDARVLGGISKDNWIQFVANTVDPATGFSAVYHGFITDPMGNTTISGNIIGHPTRDYGYPNIAWTGDENCDYETMIGFDFSSPTDFAGVGAIYFGNDSTYSSPIDLKNGENYADRHSDDYERWGDYFGIQRRYNEPKTVWMAGYFANTTKSNTTYLAEVSSPDSTHLMVTVDETGNALFCTGQLEVNGMDGNLPYLYSFNDAPFSTTNYISGICEGDTVAIKVTDARGCIFEETRIFSKTISPVQPAAFPNPFTDQMVVQFVLDSDQKLTAALYDQLGRLVVSLLDQPAKAGQNQLVFSTAPLANGTYFLRITGTGGFEMEEKVLKVE